MKIIDIKDIYLNPTAFEHINVVAWVNTNRRSGKALGFLSLNDGSCFANLQVVYKENETMGFDDAKQFETGSAVQISGVIKLTPNAPQPFELQAKEVILLASAKEFPLQKKEHSFEFLRTIAHLRHRSKYCRAIQLLRNQLSHAIHDFFYQLNFMWVHAPILTCSDTEGAGEALFLAKDDNNQDFFRKKTSLTVSAQLHAEAYALGFKKVYSFGPTFRAEKSFTNRHAAEFWMLEPEVSFATLNENFVLIESLLKHLIDHALKYCSDELDYFEEISGNKEIKHRLKVLVNSGFAKLEYRDAIEILKEAVENNQACFEVRDIHFGMDLKTEHERYLAEVVYQKPVFVYNYPKNLKAFYMKVNDDNLTVAATDLLVPGVGELVGGSEREYRYDVLKSRCHDLKVPTESLSWYLDLRKYGYYRSAGFGLGFDRLLMYLTGTENIKDVIPFPRNYQQINF